MNAFLQMRPNSFLEIHSY